MDKTEAHMPPNIKKMPSAIIRMLTRRNAACVLVCGFRLSGGLSKKNMHAGKMRQKMLPKAAPMTPSSELKKGMAFATQKAMRPQKATDPLKG